jgi:hypothetical protein
MDHANYPMHSRPHGIYLRATRTKLNEGMRVRWILRRTFPEELFGGCIQAPHPLAFFRIMDECKAPLLLRIARNL